MGNGVSGLKGKDARVVDVCLRDGLQNLKQFVPTEVKKRILDLLVVAGVGSVEVTSFVSPKAIPQMSDSREVAAYAVTTYPDIRVAALVPNLRGAEIASEVGVKDVTCVISASESHNKANVNRTIKESMSALEEIRTRLPKLRVGLSLATSFVCPFEGRIPAEKAIDMADRAINLGVQSLTFCDTIGAAGPLSVQVVAREAKSRWPGFPVGMHLHNTYGLGLANTLAAIEEGIDIFETSTGGLGGCPFAPGASGNTATEDMVYLFDNISVNSGVSLDRLIELTEYMRQSVEGKFTSSVYAAKRQSCEVRIQEDK
jgi:hydroxymethylglutaryl-CoA lyase